MWQAFWEINSDRPPSMGGVPVLPSSAIERFAHRYGIDCPDRFERFKSLLRTMDKEFLAWAKERDDGRR